MHQSLKGKRGTIGINCYAWNQTGEKPPENRGFPGIIKYKYCLT